MRSKKVFTQVISTSPADSTTIEDCSANRIQLVSALQIGGLTPSSSMIRRCLEAATIPTHVIIRHHNNGFYYSQKEKDLMLEDIIACKDLFHPAGVVIGSLVQYRTVKHAEQPTNPFQQKQEVSPISKHPVQSAMPDIHFVENVAKELGGKMKITFHKASDHMTNFPDGIKELVESHVDEILTQGGVSEATHPKNISNISHLPAEIVEHKILCGGGINFNNVNEVIEKWNAKRIHIGTCVRQGRYGPVDSKKLMEFHGLLRENHDEH